MHQLKMLWARRTPHLLLVIDFHQLFDKLPFGALIELSALHAEHVVPRGSTGPDLIDEAFLFLEGISFDAIHVFYKYQYQSTN